MATQDLDSLLKMIGKAVREALHAVDGHSVETFMGHFEQSAGAEGGPPEVKPKMVTVPFPTADGTYQQREVPTVALLHHHALQLEELRIKFRVALSEGEENQSVQVQLAPAAPADSGPQDQQFADVEMYFKRGNPPEGLARVSSEYCKSL